MRRSARAVSWGLAAILVATTSSQMATAAEVSDPTGCPGVVATGPASYQLGADLDDCWVVRDTGLQPITIDLGGHTWSHSFVSLTGEGNRLANGTFDASTVWIAGALDHVTVRNGRSFTVEAFGLLTVTDSSFESNEIGLSAYFGSATVQDCEFRDNQTGVVIGRGAGSAVEDSQFEGNRTGLLLWDEDFFGSDDVVVRGNHFEGNGVGIRVTAFSAVARARIADNQLDGNDEAGITVDVFCFSGMGCGGQGGVIEKNHARRNGFAAALAGDGDGIRVRGEDDASQPIDPTWIRLAGNQADRNADLGIDAAGVTDGGKNRAKLNGNPQQCVGVDCKVPRAKRPGKKRSAFAAAETEALLRVLLALPRH